MAKKVDVVNDIKPEADLHDRFENLRGSINKVDPRKRRGSVIKSAQENVFEFPTFVSSTITMDYATATVSLLEQVYAAYMQVAISINPVVSADSVKKGLQFADYKTDTNKYLEYTDTWYQHAMGESVYVEDGCETRFELVSADDNVARVINEAMNYEPLSEFEHFWQEAEDTATSDLQPTYPLPVMDGNNLHIPIQYEIDPTTHQIRYGTLGELAERLQNAADFNFGNGADENALAGYIRYVNAQHMTEDITAGRITNPYYRATHAIDTGVNTIGGIGKAAGNIAGAVGGTADAIYNVSTLKDRIEGEKLKNEKTRADLEDRAERLRIDKNTSNAKIAAAAPEYVDDAKCQKLNTMKPLLMKVTLNMLNKDDSLQPINYIIGVKVHTRVVPSEVLPEVAKYPLKEMDKISRKVKWRAGELKFFKDLVFRIKEKKQTAADSRDPKRKWYRRLYELAHMKGDAPTAAILNGKSVFATFLRERTGKGKLAHGLIPNASIIMSQADVDRIKAETGINLLKGSTAKKFCNELFLISFVIIDTDAQSIKILMPDMNNDFDVHSLASVEKQLATLSTAGTKTRDIFKMLG